MGTELTNELLRSMLNVSDGILFVSTKETISLNYLFEFTSNGYKLENNELVMLKSERNGTCSLEEIIEGVIKVAACVKHVKIWCKLKLGYFEDIFWNLGLQVSTLNLVENSIMDNESIYKIQRTIRNFRNNVQIAKITVNLQSVPTLFTSLKWILRVAL